MSEQPTRISDDELAYHRVAVECWKWAQQARQEADRIEGAFAQWATFLHGKYGLTVTDNVDEDGTIHRAAQTEDDFPLGKKQVPLGGA